MARAIERRLNVPQAPSVGVAYLLALVGLGIVLFTAGGAISQQLTTATDEFPQTVVRIVRTDAVWRENRG